jgi:hypothetical protein
LERIQVFPNGTIVRLSTGEIGIVVRQAEKANFRPTLRVLTDRDGKFLGQNTEVNLLDRPEITVIEVMDDYKPEEE